MQITKSKKLQQIIKEELKAVHDLDEKKKEEKKEVQKAEEGSCYHKKRDMSERTSL